MKWLNRKYRFKNKDTKYWNDIRLEWKNVWNSMLSNSRRSSFCRKFELLCKFRNKTVFWQQLESLLFGCFPFITGNHGFEMCHKYQLIFGSYQPILSYKRVGWSTYTFLHCFECRYGLHLFTFDINLWIEYSTLTFTTTIFQLMLNHI